MSKFGLRMVVALTLAAVAVTVALPVQAKAPKEKLKKYSGVITVLDTAVGSGMIKKKDKATGFKVAPDCKFVSSDGKVLKIDDFKVGDEVTLAGVDQDDGSVLCERLTQRVAAPKEVKPKEVKQ